MAETFLIRLEGGPHPGDRRVDDMDWPLPDMLRDRGGHYIKFVESALPPQAANSRVLRGAQYRWVPDTLEDEEET